MRIYKHFWIGGTKGNERVSYKNTTREERAKKHNCDGNCYGGYTENGYAGICGNVDTCPETREGEFLGTIAAIVIIIVLPIAIAVAGIIFLVSALH